MSRSALCDTLVAMNEAGEEASDEELIKRVCNQDRAAFEKLYARYGQMVIAYIAKFVFDRNLAQDIAQETFLNVWRKASQFAPGEGRSFRQWLYAIARNQAHSAGRKPGKRKETPLVEDRPDSRAASSAGVLDIKACFDKLQVENQPFAEALLLSTQGFSGPEIAEKTKSPNSTVDTRIYRARQLMKNCLDGKPRKETPREVR